MAADRFGIERTHTRTVKPSEGTATTPRKYVKHPFYSTQRWLRISAQIKADEPTCRLCGRQTKSVDHLDGIVTHNYRCNLQGLCDSCHGWKSNEFEKRFGLAQIDIFNDWHIFLNFYNPYRGTVLTLPQGWTSSHVQRMDTVARKLTVFLASCSLPGAFITWQANQSAIIKNQIQPHTLLQYVILRLAYQTTFNP